MIDPKFRKIIVSGRLLASYYEPDESFAAISINDPGDPVPFRPSMFMAAQVKVDFYDLWWEDPKSMKPEHARAIWDFLDTVPKDVKTLYVHCFAGRSRSPSAAMAICDRFDIGRAIIDWQTAEQFDSVYDERPPNPWVYNMMMAAVRPQTVLSDEKLAELRSRFDAESWNRMSE